ncbi:MAG TPA: three-Cys-motif partner protein TcmP [Acidimicrobiales bacterium]|nr:three-Cys-motif partner protein TcmP [Acidimicrobiales bacterium]
MPEPVRWEMKDHTRAKHRVLRSYLDQWIPIMGRQALRTRATIGAPPRLLLADGFAGPGRYVEGEPGSPLIMLDALQSHHDFPNLAGVDFHFLFIEQNQERYEALDEELNHIEMSANIHIHMVHGHFEDEFGSLVDDISGRGGNLIPTFSFIDPFGYSDAPMSLTGRLLEFPRTEALFFLPLSYIARFVGREGQDAALNALFGSDRWEEAIALNGAERSTFLMNLFEEQLQSQGRVKHVISFQLRTTDGQDYRLVFATGHPKGRDAMKKAMWKVDPVSGTSYTARMETGQQVLFTPEPDTGPLLAELRATFKGRWFTIEEAAEATDRTPAFLSDSHLKKRTLFPAERDDVLEVERPFGCRPRAFTEGVRMRFRD